MEHVDECHQESLRLLHSEYSHLHCVSEKNCHPFVVVITLSDIVQFCQFLVETYRRLFDTMCTAHHTLFYVFVLYLVKTSSGIYGIQYCQFSDKYEVFNHIKVKCHIR